MHQSLLPYAWMCFVVYCLGMPAWFGFTMYTHRKAIHIDQNLRAKGEGNNPYQNPVFRIRLRYKKLYENFRPELYFWRLTLMARKFLLAGTTLFFNNSPMFQASVAIEL